MATTKKFELKELLEHPMAVYATESNAALSKVRREISRLESVRDDDSQPEDQRDQAQTDIAELTSVLGRMDDADKAFLARVVLGSFPPKDEVVTRTVALNTNLGLAVAATNRVQTMIRLAAQWADTLSAVVTGKAPSMPAEPNPPAGA